VVAAADGGSGLCVVALNRAAEGAGLQPGQALADARAIEPRLIVEPDDAAAEAAALGRLVAWCGRYTPWVAFDGCGLGAGLGGAHGLWLDVTGCAHLFGGEAALLDDLLRRLSGFGFEARAALADTPGAAWAVARHGKGGVVPRGELRAALAGLPVSALRLGAAEVEALDRVGLRRIGDLYGLPRGALARRFGASIGRRLDQALGAAHEPLSPCRPVAPYRVERLFAEPIASLATIEAATLGLIETLTARLEADGRGVRRLALSLYRVDGEVGEVAIGTSLAVREPRHLMRLLAERLEGFEAAFGIDALVLAAPQTDALPRLQLGLDLEAAGPRRSAAPEDAAALGRLIDRLGNRLGPARIARAAPCQSHLPERAVTPAAALGAAGDWSAHGGRERPLRLLPRPEPIEVIAPIPDDPPLMFRWRRALHRVHVAAGPERLAPEWWRAEGIDAAAAGEADFRDYYRVEDEAGRRFWLFRLGAFRPGAPPAWFMHGLSG
jgi:protein ImuB